MKRILFIILVSLVPFLIYFSISLYRKSVGIPEEGVSLEFPLRDGSYFISNARGHSSKLEKYALDIIKIPEVREFFRFRDVNLESNSTYGIQIYSPCNGVVKNTNDGIEDQPIGIKSPQNGGGNDITINCEDGFDVYMAHIKKGTFQVKEGTIIEIGDEIAQIGNSGNTDGPHLHIHVIKYVVDESNQKAVPLPMIFNNRYLYRFDLIRN